MKRILKTMMVAVLGVGAAACGGSKSPETYLNDINKDMLVGTWQVNKFIDKIDLLTGKIVNDTHSYGVDSDNNYYLIIDEEGNMITQPIQLSEGEEGMRVEMKGERIYDRYEIDKGVLLITDQNGTLDYGVEKLTEDTLIMGMEEFSAVYVRVK